MKPRPTIIDQYVSINLKCLREDNGLSQEKLAQMVGLSPQQIQKYEKAVNRISAGTLYKLSYALQCEIRDFYEGLELFEDVRDQIADMKDDEKYKNRFYGGRYA